MPQRRFLSFDPAPCALRRFRGDLPLGGGRVLMRPGDRGVDADVPVDLASGISLGRHSDQQPVPPAVRGESMMPLPHCLPWPEPLGQITPPHARPIPEHDPLDHLPMITKPAATSKRRHRHRRLDPSPGLIADLRTSRHRDRLARATASGWETRPDMWVRLSSGQGEAVSPAIAGETASGPSGSGGGGRVGVDAWSL